jgi:hypothetical protein
MFAIRASRYHGEVKKQFRGSVSPNVLERTVDLSLPEFP